MAKKKKAAKPAGKSAGPASQTADEQLPDVEQLRRFHSLQALGKQILDVDRKLTKSRKREDDAKEELRKAREELKSLANEREEMVTEQVFISQGKFSERLAFPAAPQSAPVKDFELRDRLQTIAEALIKLPDPTFDTAEYNALSDMERRHLPKKIAEMNQEGQDLVRKLRAATKASTTVVTAAPGAHKADPLLQIRVVAFSDGKYGADWDINPPQSFLHDDTSSAYVVPDSFGDLMDDLQTLKERPVEHHLRRELFNQREAAIRNAIGMVRTCMRDHWQHPAGKLLEELQIIEQHLRDLEDSLEPEFRGERLLIMESDENDGDRVPLKEAMGAGSGAAKPAKKRKSRSLPPEPVDVA